MPNRGPIPLYADPDELRVAAQAIIDSLHSRAVAANLDRSPVPEVVVRTTPRIIYFDPAANQIVVPWWADVPSGVRQVLAFFAGGDELQGNVLFRAVFNRFFIAHEGIHWLLGHSGNVPPAELYDTEDVTNLWAVAFWRVFPDGEEFLAELEHMLDGVTARVPDPVPAGRDPAEFFGTNYQELGADPIRYGYFQFKSVWNALRKRSDLELDAMLRQSGSATP